MSSRLTSKATSTPAPPDSKDERYLSIVDLFRTLNKEGFTEAFFAHTPTAQDKLFLQNGSWKTIEEDRDLSRIGPSLVVFLRNPERGDECWIRSDGSASGWGRSGDWTQTSARHKRAYSGLGEDVWDKLHNRVDLSVSDEEQKEIEIGSDSSIDQHPNPLAPSPDLRNTRKPEIQTRRLAMLEDDRILTKQGGRYFPISLAADFVQAPRTTLLNWIKAKVNFQGRPLQVYNSPTAHKSYLAEESVYRVANRFIKWPSKDPAGDVTIGETKDLSGYVGISKAARLVGVDHHTMWLWTTHAKAPTDQPLNVIKCAASDQFYIRESDVLEIIKLIPRTGLRRGRRPRPSNENKPR